MAGDTPQASDAPKPSLVALEVAGDDSASWQTVQSALRDDAVLSIYGPFGEASPRDAAARLRDALDEEQLGPDYLCGHDFGGAIALALAAAQPWRVRGLILVDTSPEPYQPDDGETDSGVGGIVAVTSPRRRSPGFMERLEFITTPALIVVGEADAPFFQRGAELLHGWMPFSRLLRIPNAAHRPHVENPAAFAAEVAAFLREMEASRHAPR